MNKYFIIMLTALSIGVYFWISKKSSMLTETTPSLVSHDDLISGDTQNFVSAGDTFLEDEIALELFEEEDVTPALVLNGEVEVSPAQIDIDICKECNNILDAQPLEQLTVDDIVLETDELIAASVLDQEETIELK